MAKGNQLTYYTYATPHGPVTISADGRGVTSVSFDAGAGEGAARATDITNRAATQLQEYLAGKRRDFDVPLNPQGSAFQHAVWAEVSRIPYGGQLSAADVAAAMGKPGAHRSVGTALRANPVAPFVPTHRVPNANATGKQARVLRGFLALERRCAAEVR